MGKIKKIELSFACGEDWNKMTVLEQGRHCASCQKSVIDFSFHSDRQIISFYEDPKNATICGRFRTGQLEQLNENINVQIQKKPNNFLRPIVATALLTAACSSDGIQGEISVEPQKNRTEQVEDTLSKRTLGEVGIVNESDSTRKDESSNQRKVVSIKKDTAIYVQEIPTTTVTQSYYNGTVLKVEKHTAGVPLMTFEDDLIKKVPLHKRVIFKIKNFFRRKR